MTTKKHKSESAPTKPSDMPKRLTYTVPEDATLPPEYLDQVDDGTISITEGEARRLIDEFGIKLTLEQE